MVVCKILSRIKYTESLLPVVGSELRAGVSNSFIIFICALQLTHRSGSTKAQKVKHIVFHFKIKTAY